MLKEIEFLKFRLRGELATRMNDKDIADVLKVLQSVEEHMEKLKKENQWLYEKLNIISDVIEEARNNVPKV